MYFDALSASARLLALVGLVVFSGCSASQAISSADAHDQVAIERALRAAESDWRGVPHRFGGSTRQGIDCSAFVQAVYRDVFAQELPRTTAEQVQLGSAISTVDLRPGDLVFFRPTTKTRHVGVYLSQGEFAHASASRGVMISNLEEAYWHRHYWTARRVVPSAARAEVTTPQPTVLSPPKPRRRVVGW